MNNLHYLSGDATVSATVPQLQTTAVGCFSYVVYRILAYLWDDPRILVREGFALVPRGQARSVKPVQ